MSVYHLASLVGFLHAAFLRLLVPLALQLAFLRLFEYVLLVSLVLLLLLLLLLLRALILLDQPRIHSGRQPAARLMLLLLLLHQLIVLRLWKLLHQLVVLRLWTWSTERVSRSSTSSSSEPGGHVHLRSCQQKQHDRKYRDLPASESEPPEAAACTARSARANWPPSP